MFRLKKILLIIFTVVVILISLSVAVSRLVHRPTPERISERFITSNPFQLTQIQGFSKYRSCEGHDYRAPSVTGESEATPRSMKHYVKVKPEFRGTVDRVYAFAPFDGEISDVENEVSSNGSQVWLTPNSKGASRWHFIFFHIELDKNLKQGSTVKAGQLIGTAYLAGGADNFDIALKFTQPIRRPAIDTPFNHVTQEVLDEYAKYGISAGDLIISKEERNASPCPLSSKHEGSDVFFLSNSTVDNYVWLTPPTDDK